MNKKAITLLALTSVIGLAQSAIAKPVKFVIDDPKGRDSVSFNSNAPIEVINGHTNKVTGFIELDDSLDLKKPVSAQFDVDLASIDTGIALRNEHMRDNFLETKKFPKATFKLKSIASGATTLQDKQKVQLKTVGDFTVHGKTVAKDVTLDVTYFKTCPATSSKFENCNLLQVNGSFTVPFKDHDIKRPEIVFQKLADTVTVTVALTAHEEGGAPAKAAPNSEKKPAAKTPAKSAK
ncbi:MAG TPA: YceI family protein [Drouetiella sp.]